MKKIVLSAALIATGIFATAQKNTILVAGEVGYATSNEKTSGYDYDTDQLTLNPKIGYQFNDHMTIGAEWNFQEGTTDTAAGEAYDQDQKIGGFLRYSMPLNNTFSAFADLGTGYQYVANNLNGVEQSAADGIYASLTPALFINMKNGFGLNFNIGGIEYSNLSEKAGYSSQDNDDFSFNFGKEVGFGISKNFGTPKSKSASK